LIAIPFKISGNKLIIWLLSSRCIFNAEGLNRNNILDPKTQEMENKIVTVSGFAFGREIEAQKLILLLMFN